VSTTVRVGNDSDTSMCVCVCVSVASNSSVPRGQLLGDSVAGSVSVHLSASTLCSCLSTKEAQQERFGRGADEHCCKGCAAVQRKSAG